MDRMDTEAPEDTESTEALALQAGAAAEENRIQLGAAVGLLMELAVQIRQEAGLAESPSFVEWRQKGENLLRHLGPGRCGGPSRTESPNPALLADLGK